jgi:hypothetical protein
MLAPGRRARRVDRGRVRVESEMRQDRHDDRALCDQRDQSAMGATLSTEQDVQTEDPAH